MATFHALAGVEESASCSTASPALGVDFLPRGCEVVSDCVLLHMSLLLEGAERPFAVYRPFTHLLSKSTWLFCPHSLMFTVLLSICDSCLAGAALRRTRGREHVLFRGSPPRVFLIMSFQERTFCMLMKSQLSV